MGYHGLLIHIILLFAIILLFDVYINSDWYKCSFSKNWYIQCEFITNK